MKAVWQGRMMQASSKYGEHAPMAAVCCNACRTCATTNLVSLGLAAVAGAGALISRKLTRRQHV
ncbi:MAG TPA: hypothetical protein VIA10_00090 [Gaiellaceae bacterium]|jgi:hypothetical protein